MPIRHDRKGRQPLPLLPRFARLEKLLKFQMAPKPARYCAILSGVNTYCSEELDHEAKRLVWSMTDQEYNDARRWLRDHP